MSRDRLTEIRDRFEAIIPGPWRWYGNTATDQVFLGTTDRGRLILLDCQPRLEEWVFDHDTMEGYTIEEARSRAMEWCPVHGDPEFPGDPQDRTVHCRCDAIREFLFGTLDQEEGRRDLTRGVHTWLTRHFQVHAELRFASKRGDTEARKQRGGQTLQSYREAAKYEVLGYRTKIKWEMDQGGVVPSADHDIKNFLYREDFCGIDNPEAEFIERAPEDIGYLLARIEEISRQTREVGERLGLSWEPDCSTASMVAKLGHQVEIQRRRADRLEEALAQVAKPGADQ